MKPIVAVALSGGVDSMMAAFLLKGQGADVFGVHFSTGFPGGPAEGELQHLADRLGIPLHCLDVSAAFQKKVVDYFTASYTEGKTPNPCLVCNAEIKFGVLFDSCKGLGASHLATGHYARIKQDAGGKYHLYRGKDATKDQSYFLSRLSQEQLSRAFFPLGEFTKRDVKQLARQKGLDPVTSDESQDVCFIRGSSYGEFLAALPGFSPQGGNIEDRNGNVLGMHRGLHLFTIGQRRGINCPAGEPYYVLKLDGKTGRLIVGKKSETLTETCRVEGIRWIQNAPSHEIHLDTRIRYRHQAAPSLVGLSGATSALVRFQTPQKAVTPGQGAVFYKGDEVLGGGWISESLS